MARNDHTTSSGQRREIDDEPRTLDDLARDESGNIPADEAAALFDRLARDLADMEDRWKRALADFQNFQRRASGNEAQAHARGVRDACQGLLCVLDSLDLALSQDPQAVSAQQMHAAVGAIREEAAKALASQGVTAIDPSPGDAFDPAAHEAVMRQPARGVAPGHVSAIHQRGYAMGERVLRPAKVSVAPPEEESEQQPAKQSDAAGKADAGGGGQSASGGA